MPAAPVAPAVCFSGPSWVSSASTRLSFQLEVTWAQDQVVGMVQSPADVAGARLSPAAWTRKFQPAIKAQQQGAEDDGAVTAAIVECETGPWIAAREHPGPPFCRGNVDVHVRLARQVAYD